MCIIRDHYFIFAKKKGQLVSESRFKFYAGDVQRLCPVLADCVNVVKRKQLNLSVLVVDELD